VVNISLDWKYKLNCFMFCVHSVKYGSRMKRAKKILQ